MNVAMRRMLDQVADQVTTVIHAPEELADCFDEHGCLVPEMWQNRRIGITTEQIRVVEGPREQAQEMVRCLGAFGGRYRADQIVIGVLDETLVPQLLRELEESDVAARWVVGRAMRETAPYRLLEALASFLGRRRFRDFAALVRHPDVSAWLTERVATDRWLIELDEYHGKHLQPRLGEWLDDFSRVAALKKAVSLIEDVVEPLCGSRRPLSKWATAVAGLLSAFYGERTFRLDREQDTYTLKALEQIRENLLACREVPTEIDSAVTAAQAITQLLSRISNAAIPPPRQEGQIELLGWLELPLDTAPALVVTGFNEGKVPTSANSDLFLPNQLREQLGLVDNRRRYARDAYALCVLEHSRTHLTLIAGRVSADHDPLVPSRLAFATDRETMAARALSFFRGTSDEAAAAGAGIPRELLKEHAGIVVPRPVPLATPITAISVTAFRTYMECPYRFYLRHVLSLDAISDTAEELDAAAYGTLIHDVLKRLGQDSVRDSTEPDRIDRFLRKTLDQLVRERLGEDRLPAVDVQLAQARHRLRGFADWQAQRTREGWEIVYTETSGGDEPARLTIDGERFVLLKGRIDRIDRRDNEWAILDYKTGDTAKSPQETHLKGGEWIDLQLPLYVHLARTLKLDGTLRLGYILLPKETEKIGASMADWDAATLESADSRALEVARDIVAGKFWPPSRLSPGTVTDFAGICQEHAFRPRLAVADIGEGA